MDEGKQYAETTEAQPLWSRANDTLNAIREDLMSRAATIEGEQKRLSDEYSHVMSALNRIVPHTSEPMSNYPTPPNQSLNQGVGLRASRW